MSSLTVSPIYPVPTREAAVTFTIASGAANYVRAWVTVAPVGSDLANKLTTSTQSRFGVYNGDAGPDNPWRFTPDKGGKYTLVVQEYQKGSGYGGGFQDDPNGGPSETKIGAETTLYVYVGERVTTTLGSAPDTATLVVWVWNDSIRATTVAGQGEDSPAVIEPQGQKGPTAAADTTFLASVAALANQTVTAAIGDIPGALFYAALYYDVHRTQIGVHANNDTVNVVGWSFYIGGGTATGLAAGVNQFAKMYSQHIRNDYAGQLESPAASGKYPSGPGTARFHEPTSGQNSPDWTNVLVSESGVSGINDSLAKLADLYRAFEAHRISASHSTPDTTNVLPPLPPIAGIHKRFMQVLSQTTPTAPPAANSGAITLIHSAGFEES